MPYTIEPLRKNQAIPSFHELLVPVYKILSHTPPLEEKGHYKWNLNTNLKH